MPTPNTLGSITEDQPEIAKTPMMLVRQLHDKMSQDASFDDILYEIDLLARLKEAMDGADAGNGVPMEQAKEQAKQWFRN